MVLLAVVGVLTILNVVAIVAEFHFGFHSAKGLVPFLSFDSERSLPTFVSSLLLLGSGILLAAIARYGRHDGTGSRPWAILSGLFVFLAIDEFASIHERFIQPTRNLLETSGLLYSAWIIPYGLLLLVVAAAFRRFLNDLPRALRALFLLSGAIYVFGAVGFESIGGRHFEALGARDLSYAVYYTCEEILEMVGVSVFIYALLGYIAVHLPSIMFRVEAGEWSDAPSRTAMARGLNPEEEAAAG